MKDYEKIAIEILEDVTGTDGLAEEKDLNLFEEGLLDSMAIISIILQIEEKMGLTLEPTDFKREDVQSINHFAAYLKAKDED